MDNHELRVRRLILRWGLVMCTLSYLAGVWTGWDMHP